MGRWDKRYSTEQREAVVEAIVDRGMSAQVAVDAAKAGELGLPPFDFARGTAADYASKERRRRQGKIRSAAERDMNAEQRIDSHAARALNMIDTALARLEKAQRKGQFGADQVELLRKLMASEREIRSLVRGMAKTTGGSVARREQEAARKPPSEGDSTSSVLSELSAELQSQRSNGNEKGESSSGTGSDVPSPVLTPSSSEPLPA